LNAGSANPVTITAVALKGKGLSTTDENDLSLVSVVRFGRFDAEFGQDLSGLGTGTADGDPVDPSAPNPNPPPRHHRAVVHAPTRRRRPPRRRSL